MILLMMMMPNNMQNTMVRRITNHQIHVSTVDQQLLVLWVISGPVMHEMVVRPVTCESTVVSVSFDTSQRSEEKCVNTQFVFDSRGLRFLVKNKTKQQENVNYADFISKDKMYHLFFDKSFIKVPEIYPS